jgi:probable selenium-dependent hydroxylase accessory protein YqeC
LYRAFNVSKDEIVAFAGAGGKSSAIIATARELRAGGMRTLVVPTTKMFVEEADRIGPIVTAEDPEALLVKVEDALANDPVVVAGSSLLSRKRVAGVEPEAVKPLAELAEVTLVEADGSRRHPIKGTGPHEPALPPSATLVVAVASIRAFGQPATADHVHRPELFAQQTGISVGQTITAAAFARALARGTLGRVPEHARSAALITAVAPGPSMSDASAVARELWRLGVSTVVLASLPPDGPPQAWIA